MHNRLVGRERERYLGLQLLAGVEAGQGATLVLRGPSGIGKTRLVTELTTDASTAGFTVLRAAAVEGGSMSPLLPLRRLLRHLPSLPMEASMGLVPGIAPPFAHPLAGLVDAVDFEVAPPASRDWWQAVEACAEAILGVAETHPLLVTIDDAHWADRQTLQALVTLSGRLPAARCLLVVSYRDDRGPSGGQLQLSTLARESGNVTEVELGPLDWIQSRDLLSSMCPAGQAPDIELTDRLVESTGGNPLYLEDAARAMATGRNPLEPSRRLLGAVAVRIEEIGEDAGEILSAAAAIGETFEIATLCRLCEKDEGDVFPALRAAVGAGILTEPLGTERLEFAHPIVRQAASQLRLRAEQARLHATLARWMWAEQGPSAARLVAQHAEVAGECRLCAEAAAVAAGQAKDAGFLHDAAVHFERAFRAMEPGGEVPASVHLADAAEAWMAAGNSVRAAELFTELGGRAAASGDLASAAYAYAKALRANFTVEGLALASEAAPAIDLEATGERAYVRAALIHATSSGLSHGGPHLLREAEDVLALAAESGSNEARGVALLAYGNLVAGTVDFERGCGLLEECAELSRRANAWRDEHEALLALVTLKTQASQLAAAQALAEQASTSALHRHALRPAGHFAAKLAHIERLSGDWDRARDHARRATLLTDHLDTRSLHVAHIARARIAADSGRWDEVEGELAWATRQPGALDGYFPGSAWFSLRAQLRQAVGDLAGAVTAAAAPYRLWQATGEAYNGCEQAALYVGLLVDVGRVDDARVALTEMQRRLASLPPPTRRVARGWVARAEASLALADRSEETAARRLEEAVGVWRAAAVPYQRALAELQLARVRLDSRREEWRGRAHELLVAADETFTRLGAAEAASTAGLLRRQRWSRPTPGAMDELLTEREQEVAALAAEGLTNQEIAERIVLSRRTVENHLARIYAKTGVHTRAGLGAFLFARG